MILEFGVVLCCCCCCPAEYVAGTFYSVAPPALCCPVSEDDGAVVQWDKQHEVGWRGLVAVRRCCTGGGSAGQEVPESLHDEVRWLGRRRDILVCCCLL